MKNIKTKLFCLNCSNVVFINNLDSLSNTEEIYCPYCLTKGNLVKVNNSDKFSNEILEREELINIKKVVLNTLEKREGKVKKYGKK